VLAALCLAPGTLARAGVLTDRAATAWPDARPVLEAAGAGWTGEPVTVHAGIVTADGPMHAKEFAAAVLGRLSSL
jgi:putative intracellular protease/amidase